MGYQLPNHTSYIYLVIRFTEEWDFRAALHEALSEYKKTNNLSVEPVGGVSVVPSSKEYQYFQAVMVTSHAHKS